MVLLRSTGAEVESPPYYLQRSALRKHDRTLCGRSCHTGVLSEDAGSPRLLIGRPWSVDDGSRYSLRHERMQIVTTLRLFLAQIKLLPRLILLEAPDVEATIPMLRGVWGAALRGLDRVAYEEVFAPQGQDAIPGYLLRPAPPDPEIAPALHWFLFGDGLAHDESLLRLGRGFRHGPGTSAAPVFLSRNSFRSGLMSVRHLARRRGPCRTPCGRYRGRQPRRLAVWIFRHRCASCGRGVLSSSPRSPTSSSAPVAASVRCSMPTSASTGKSVARNVWPWRRRGRFAGKAAASISIAGPRRSRPNLNCVA